MIHKTQTLHLYFQTFGSLTYNLLFTFMALESEQGLGW